MTAGAPQQLGELDTQVTILKRVSGRDAIFRTDTASWPPLDDPVWAKVEDVPTAQTAQVADAIDLTLEPVRLWIHWRDDVKPTMRLSIEGREGEFEIKAGPVTVGRQQWLMMVAERASTRGQRP